jgi:hypothetical protein
MFLAHELLDGFRAHPIREGRTLWRNLPLSAGGLLSEKIKFFSHGCT